MRIFENLADIQKHKMLGRSTEAVAGNLEDAITVTSGSAMKAHANIVFNQRERTDRTP